MVVVVVVAVVVVATSKEHQLLVEEFNSLQIAAATAELNLLEGSRRFLAMFYMTSSLCVRDLSL